jgi:hypothetical protein
MKNFNNMTKDELVNIINNQQAMIADMEERPEITSSEAAFGALAETLHDHGRVWNRELHDFIDGNTLHWAQEQILNGLCFTLNNKLTWFEDMYVKQVGEVEKERKVSTGDEISVRNLDKLQDRLEKKLLEVSIISDMYDAAKSTYETEVGYPFHIKTQYEVQQGIKERAAKDKPDLAAVDLRAKAAAEKMAAIMARRAA